MARQDHPAARILPSANELFRDPGRLGLVVVASPNKSHYEWALQSIRSGLPVVIDKPLAATEEQGRRLVDEAGKAKVLLSVFQNRRWDSDFLTVRSVLDRGELGDVARFESRMERWRPNADTKRWRESPAPADAGGLLYDLGSHLIDQAVQLFGEVTAVYAELDHHRKGSLVDDDVFVSLRHTAGQRSHLWASALVTQPGPRFRVVGSTGVFTKSGIDVQESQLASGLRPGQTGWAIEDTIHEGVVTTEAGTRTVRTLPGRYEHYYEQLHKALDSGQDPPVDASESVYVLRIIEAARRSASQAEIVTLDR